MIPMGLNDLVCAQTTIFKFSKFNFTLLRFMTGLYNFMTREVKKLKRMQKNQFFALYNLEVKGQ